MEKTVVFSDKDKALIEQIEACRKEGASFEETVKELCKTALSANKNLVWGEF